MLYEVITVGLSRGEMSAEAPLGLGVAFHGHAERLGDACGGDVVMGGTDAAGGEDVVAHRPAASYNFV